MIRYKIDKKISMTILLLCASNSITTAKASDEEFCRLKEPATLQVPHPPHHPGYFFKPLPASDQVPYTVNLGDVGRANFIFDLRSGEERQIPGKFDAVPTPDEKFITIPTEVEDSSGNSTTVQKRELVFYRYQGLQQSLTPVYRDSEVSGTYQSIGVLSSGPDSIVYRIVADQGNQNPPQLSIREYEATLKDGEYQIRAIGPVRKLCPNRLLALPMISKDGMELGAYDVNSGETKIFRLGASGDQCSEVLALGFLSGKVDFSFDRKNIAFHVMNNPKIADRWFSIPDSKYVMNVYVYERDTDSIRPITHNLRTNSVYPAYFKDGRILYLNHATDPLTKKKEASFTIADPSRAPSLPLDFLRRRMEDTKQERRFHAIVALGSLWSYHCSEFGSQVSATAAALRALSLDSTLCRQRVKDLWSVARPVTLSDPWIINSTLIRKELLEQLTEGDLISACPGN